MVHNSFLKRPFSPAVVKAFPTAPHTLGKGVLSPSRYSGCEWAKAKGTLTAK